jgi:hypothetical protein
MIPITTEHEQGMPEPIARRRVLVSGLSLVLVALGRGPAARAASKPTITVHKSPT